VAPAKEIAVLTEKINAEPGNASLLHQRAKLLIAKGAFEEALADMQRVMVIDSTQSEYFITMADLSFAANRTFNAKNYLEKALALDSTNSEAAMRLAELYFIVRDYNGAMKVTDDVLRQNEKNTTALFMKAMIYKENGDTAKAVRTFQKNDPAAEGYFTNAIKVNPRSEEAFYGRGLWYQEHNELDKAIRDYTTIVQMNPKNAQAHFNLGYIHHVILKVYPEAIKHYTRAIEANPRYAEAWYNRGISYEAVGNMENAAIDFKEALKVRPVYPPAEEALKRVSAPM
jgi:tetratricopeptide (TPR) repeat protein